jgi:hypothetical protein
VLSSGREKEIGKNGAFRYLYKVLGDRTILLSSDE